MIKKYGKVLFVPIIIMVVGYFLLVIVDCIPYRWIKKEAEESAEILSDQGVYPSGYLEGWFLDNWTDADCISIVINKSSNNPFFNAIHAFQMASEDDPQISSIEALQSTVDGNATLEADHSYLWNGFQIWLRILMVKYNITEIRCLMYLTMLLFSTVICALIVRENNSVWSIIPFFVSFSFFNFQMESLSILFFTDIMIMLVGCFAILMYQRTDVQITYIDVNELCIFAAMGSLVAFFSMLITPLLTLGLPLVLSIRQKKTRNDKSCLTSFLANSASWLFSFALTLVTKMILSTMLIGQNKGKSPVAAYLGNSDIAERLDTIADVFVKIGWESEVKIQLAVLLLAVLTVFVLWKKRGNLIRYKYYTLSSLLISIFPCVWCFVMEGHAGHGWTKWLYSISLFALLQMLWEFSEFPRLKK